MGRVLAKYEPPVPFLNIDMLCVKYSYKASSTATPRYSVSKDADEYLGKGSGFGWSRRNERTDLEGPDQRNLVWLRGLAG